MRKILIIVIIVILLMGFALVVTSGLKIGNTEIASFRTISEQNAALDEKIENLNNQISNDYVTRKSNLDASFKKLKNSKEKYQSIIAYSTEDEIKKANQTEKYKIGYLWTKIGMYATKNNVIMQASVSKGSSEDLYNIAFTAIGEYLSISEFIYQIENDENLGFKIEDFSMSPYSGTLATNIQTPLYATFSIRNIPIEKESLSNN